MSAPPIELVVTDLDGTLWDAGERIHDRTLAALRELQDRRVPLLVATGRRPRSAATALARSGLTPPAVLLDGAIGRDLPDGRIFHRRCFAPDVAAAALQAFAVERLSPCVYVERPDADVVVGPDPSTHPRHVEMIGEWLGHDDLAGVVTRDPVYAFGVVGRDRDVLQGVAERIAASTTAHALVTRDVFFGGATLMVRPQGINKWEGVLSFCADRGLDSAHVLALGDGENDLELLTGARVSCVVSDGCDAALALADHVIDPAHDGGWCRVLELL